MKNRIKVFGLIAFIAVIWFATTAQTASAQSTVLEIPGMVWIPAGTFTMGSPVTEPGHYDQEIQHQVSLTRGFYMGIYPVTQAQYQAVMGTNPSAFSSGGSQATRVAGLNTNNFPVEQVSWYDAIVFCNRLSMQEGLSPAYRINGSTNPSAWGNVPTGGNAAWNAVEVVAGSNGYRLPTEAQWEYACRAETTTAYNWGADNISSNAANYDASGVDTNNTALGTYISRTTEVGSYAPNAWGLYDMHGNVWEWCFGWTGAYASGAQTDPTGPEPSRTREIRGGSWNSYGRSLRSATRSGLSPYSSDRTIGFRLVRL